jgi:hypothetical protein
MSWLCSVLQVRQISGVHEETCSGKQRPQNRKQELNTTRSSPLTKECREMIQGSAARARLPCDGCVAIRASLSKGAACGGGPRGGRVGGSRFDTAYLDTWSHSGLHV